MARLLRLRSVSPLLIGAVAVIVPFLVMTTHGHHKVMLSGTVHFWAIWPAAAAATAAAIRTAAPRTTSTSRRGS